MCYKQYLGTAMIRRTNKLPPLNTPANKSYSYSMHLLLVLNCDIFIYFSLINYWLSRFVSWSDWFLRFGGGDLYKVMLFQQIMAIGPFFDGFWKTSESKFLPGYLRTDDGFTEFSTN